MKQIILARSQKHREAEETAWMCTDIRRSRDNLGGCKESRAKCPVTKALCHHTAFETKTRQLARHSWMLLELFHQIWYFNSQTVTGTRSINKHGWVPRKLCLWIWEFEFHIISTCHENTIYLLLLSPSSKNVKIILHRPYKNQVQIKLAHGL